MAGVDRLRAGRSRSRARTFSLEPDDRLYSKMLKMQAQILKLNDITRKVGNIKKYEAVDYVAGIKIVDIDRAS